MLLNSLLECVNGQKLVEAENDTPDGNAVVESISRRKGGTLYILEVVSSRQVNWKVFSYPLIFAIYNIFCLACSNDILCLVLKLATWESVRSGIQQLQGLHNYVT